MKTLTVIGTLSPSNGEDVNNDTRVRIYEALAASGIGGIVPRELMESGVIKVNKSALVESPSAPLSFIRKLKEVMSRPTIAELGLKGEISVALVSSAPAVFNVTIRGEKFTCRKATIAWKSEPMPL
jgi:hypothetical protein